MHPTELLITSQELSQRLDEPSLRVFDCRWSLTDVTLGLRQYQEGRIPHSQYIPLEHHLSDPAGFRGRHPLPSRSRFAEILGESYGVSNESLIVAYDDGSGMTACRLWWMARWVGHKNVRVLDGGLYQWTKQGFPLTTDSVQYESVDFQLGESLTRSRSVDEVIDSSTTLLDARSSERFEGQVEPIDHTAGHIPGALCFPYDANLTSEKTFVRNPTRFDSIDRAKPVACYCGSGVSATNNILALLLAGFDEPVLYAGSWSEWIESDAREIATGPARGT